MIRRSSHPEKAVQSSELSPLDETGSTTIGRMTIGRSDNWSLRQLVAATIDIEEWVTE